MNDFFTTGMMFAIRSVTHVGSGLFEGLFSNRRKRSFFAKYGFAWSDA